LTIWGVKGGGDGRLDNGHRWTKGDVTHELYAVSTVSC